MIRRGTLEHVNAIARVNVDTWRTSYHGIIPATYLESMSYHGAEERWRAWFRQRDPSEHLWVAQNETGDVCGYVNGGKNREGPSAFQGELYRIYLATAYQRKGLGKELFLHSMSQLYRDGHASAFLWVLEVNPSRRFYEALGGRLCGERWIEVGGANLREVAYGWDDLLGALQKIDPSLRHPCIVSADALQELDNAHYPGSDEKLSIGSPFGRYFGFARLGIHREILKPGRRTSWPHAESTEDELVFVVRGHPLAWIDGRCYRLSPGDGVGYKAGSGIVHTFLNEENEDAHLIVVGDTTRADNKVYYPHHPDRNVQKGDGFWRDWPVRDLGPHDGKPQQR